LEAKDGIIVYHFVLTQTFLRRQILIYQTQQQQSSKKLHKIYKYMVRLKCLLGKSKWFAYLFSIKKVEKWNSLCDSYMIMLRLFVSGQKCLLLSFFFCFLFFSISWLKAQLKVSAWPDVEKRQLPKNSMKNNFQLWPQVFNRRKFCQKLLARDFYFNFSPKSFHSVLLLLFLLCVCVCVLKWFPVAETETQCRQSYMRVYIID